MLCIIFLIMKDISSSVVFQNDVSSASVMLWLSVQAYIYLHLLAVLQFQQHILTNPVSSYDFHR